MKKLFIRGNKPQQSVQNNTSVTNTNNSAGSIKPVTNFNDGWHKN